MRIVSNIAYITRGASLFLLASVVHLFFPDFFPLIPVAICVLCALLASSLASRTELRIIPLVIIAILVVILLYFILYFIASAVSNSFIHFFFLHVSLGKYVFLSLFIFIYTSTIAQRRFSLWKTIEPICLILLFSLMFWSQGGHKLTIFSHPLQLALYTGSFILLLLVSILLSTQHVGKAILHLVSLLPLVAISFFVTLSIWNTLSVSNNGGLLQPTLFRFDFSPYLSLQSEIKLRNNLVLVVKVQDDDAIHFMRRTILSGWNPQKGFYPLVAPDEEQPPTQVPSSYTKFTHTNFKLRYLCNQDYFIVNFDPSSFIAMDYPTEVTPWKIWPGASFNSAFSVQSQVPLFMPFELYDSPFPTGSIEEGLSGKDLEFYTQIDPQTYALVSETAQSLTKNHTAPYDKTVALVNYFTNDPFRYSLKPGIATDGNQLRHFLEISKKGYCTYYAFALTLMLRSIQIPARVAVGFFIEPNSGTLGYYPVRANMAHAWVEVFFPHLGWITFDPTSQIPAEGEDLSFISSAAGEDFLPLVTELIENTPFMVPSQTISSMHNLTSFSTTLISFVQNNPFISLCIVLICFVLCFIAIKLRIIYRIHYSSNPRQRILSLSPLVDRLCGVPEKYKSNPLQKYIHYKAHLHPDFYTFFKLEQKARFSPICTKNDAEAALNLYRKLRTTIPFRFRFIKLFLCISLILVNLPSYTQDQSTPPSVVPMIQDIQAQADQAIRAENWDSALRALTQGTRLYPQEPQFFFKRGSIYLEQGLYEPALKDLLNSEQLGLTGKDILYSLANCFALLNQDQNALQYQIRYLELVPDDVFEWSNLGWLYYKTNRIDEGIDTLKAVINRFGPDGNLCVTLGNLYTSAFDYQNAKKYYDLAIDFAQERSQSYLVSVYYYNRSVLEEVFYRWDQANADSQKSLEAAPRSSGYLMQGELSLRRLDLPGAYNYYARAYAHDGTPLAVLGMADTLLQGGKAVEAHETLKVLDNNTDYSWISHYGTTVDHFLADIHRLYRDIYHHRKGQQKDKIIHNFSTFVNKYSAIISYSLHAWYHDGKYRIHSKLIAQRYAQDSQSSQFQGGLSLYKNSYSFLALDTWRNVSQKYLRTAKDIEVSHIPASLPSYFLEEGKLFNNKVLLEQSIQTLDPIWERKFKAQALGEYLLRFSRQSTTHYHKHSYDLFSLQPSAFTFYSLQLPVMVSIINSNLPASRIEKKLIRTLASTLLSGPFLADPDSSLVLQITSFSDRIELALIDTTKKFTICTQVFHNKQNSAKKELVEQCNLFIHKVFSSQTLVQ